MKQAIREAESEPLDELAKQVIYGNFTPGIHDKILINRCRKADNMDMWLAYCIGVVSILICVVVYQSVWG